MGRIPIRIYSTGRIYRCGLGSAWTSRPAGPSPVVDMFVGGDVVDDTSLAAVAEAVGEAGGVEGLPAGYALPSLGLRADRWLGKGRPNSFFLIHEFTPYPLKRYKIEL